MMKRVVARQLTLTALLMSSLAGCRTDPFEVAVSLPNQRAFLHSTAARVLVYEARDGDLNAQCGALIRDIQLDSNFGTPVFDTDFVPPCELVLGTTIPEQFLPNRPVLIAVATEDTAGGIMTVGCTVSNAWEESQTEVLVQTTGYYDQNYGSQLTVCASAEERCNGDCAE